jgi:hypothetical protein
MNENIDQKQSEILLQEIIIENYIFFNKEPLKQAFGFDTNERMMQAEFYAYCKGLNIPCILEVPVNLIDKRFLLDAIIDINNQFILFEFKINKCRPNKLKRNQLVDQVSSYYQLGYPLIILDNFDDYGQVIDICKLAILENGIYEYDIQKDGLKRIDYFGEQIKCLNSKLYK